MTSPGPSAGSSLALVIDAATSGPGPLFCTGYVAERGEALELHFAGNVVIPIRDAWRHRILAVGDLLAVAVMHGALWMLQVDAAELTPRELAVVRSQGTHWPGVTA